jgi:chorismate synthase
MLKESAIKVLGFVISINGIIHIHQKHNSTLGMAESRAPIECWPQESESKKMQKIEECRAYRFRSG